MVVSVSVVLGESLDTIHDNVESFYDSPPPSFLQRNRRS